MFYERSRKSWRRFDQLLLRNSDMAETFGIPPFCQQKELDVSWIFPEVVSNWVFSWGWPLENHMILPRNLTRNAAHNMSGTFFARFSSNFSKFICCNWSYSIMILSLFLRYHDWGNVMVYPSEVNQTYGCEALKPGGWAHKPWLAMDFIPISHEVESTRKILGGLVSHYRVTWYVNRKNIRKIQNRFF